MIATLRSQKFQYGWNKIKLEDNLINQKLFDILSGYTEDIPDFLRLLKDYQLPSVVFGPMDHLRLLRQLLSIILIFKDSLDDEETHEQLCAFSHKILAIPYWHEFQLISFYVHFCKFLLKEDEGSDFNLVQNENGSILLEYGCHLSWAGIVQQPFLAELGTLLALYGEISQDPLILKQADLVCKWQKLMLDCNGIPVHGLFSQEKHGSMLSSLAWNYLLFATVGTFLEKNEFLIIAKRQQDHFKKNSDLFSSNLPLIFGVLENFIHQNDLFFDLEEVGLFSQIDHFVHDSDHALVGVRSQKITSISTTLGGKTGLGAYLLNPYLGVVTFGPQQLPFDDCDGFGIESAQWLQKKFNSGITQITPTGYSIKGFAKLTNNKFSIEHYATFGNSKHSEDWIDITQILNNSKLDIQIAFLTFKSTEVFSFTFYVKASTCKINQQILIKSKSLEKYSGDVAFIECINEEKRFTITPHFNVGTMEIIPLTGGNDFWSGDFLIGFSISDTTLRYNWTLETDD
mgnify:CR=1 FL=1